ncbi:TBC1 domain family member 31 [Zeugodacus cucurbitae]|uniref:TBC1 domain family member 31 n=1 Tax=Zeugodacus cucurbitae TaxID=28588 RepID=UPI0023D9176B|nr:TBC1 domain family member 31 [Zeugodacus cucurbitae]XP_054090116.1 TBC1 domain family member 31 [Zeugodacus cucurbitae]
MANNGESADKIVPNSVNEKNSPKNVEAPNAWVQEIVDEIQDAAVTGSAENNAEEENLNAAVSPTPLENMNDYEQNPQDDEQDLHDYSTYDLPYVPLGKEIPERKYPFRLKNDKGKILTTFVNLDRYGVRSSLIVTCAFNQNCSLIVLIAECGYIYALDLVRKHYWRLNEKANNATIITTWTKKNNHFLIGNLLGEIALLDLDKSNKVIKRRIISKDVYILSISVPDPSTKRSNLVVVQTGLEAIMFDVEQFVVTHRLLFTKNKLQLKFASYFPQSDKIFCCFTNDAVQVWSGVNLQNVRMIQPLKMRDRKLRMQGAAGLSADFVLCQDYKDYSNVDCKITNYSAGMIMHYCFHPDNGLLCLSTLDGYLLLINTYTLELQHICRLQDFILKNCVFLNQSKELLICGVTHARRIESNMVILNCLKKDVKLVIPIGMSPKLSISPDGKLLSVITANLNIWSVCDIYNALKSQEECLRLLKLSFKQNKPVLLGPSRRRRSALAAQEESLNEDIRNLLSRERLISVLREFHWFPSKYRVLIWCALLQLPYNRTEFYQLLKMGIPPLVKQRAQQLQIRNGALKNALIRIWSCLAHWCPVFAHCKFLPQLIFPFVKLLPRHSLVVFEICVTLLTNHFQLWFEFHPLEPKNYLGLCENILQYECPKLCKFYASMHVSVEHYAWPLLSTAFSEIFSEDDWLRLWDNILTSPPYYPIFIVVAYNIAHHRVITRLPDKPTILAYFHEQNPSDVSLLIKSATRIMRGCPKTLHPERYMTELQCIPKKVYPKFLNYPREWLAKHEQDIAAVQREKQCIDARIRQLELEEMKLMERLQCGLRREEHAKQVKKMEKLYRDSLKREEERLACQRQMLTMYQKELRNRKAEVAAQVQESEQRQRALQMEKDLELLMQSIECERTRNDADLFMAEEELRNQEMELFVQKCLTDSGACSLRTKYYNDIKKLCNERRELKQQVNELSNIPKPTYKTKQNRQLDTIEERIEELQKEFNEILNSKE